MGKMCKAIWLSTRPGGVSAAVSPTIPWDADEPMWMAAIFEILGPGRVEVSVQASCDESNWCEVGRLTQAGLGGQQLVVPGGKYLHARSTVELRGYEVDALVDWGRVERPGSK